MKQKPEKAEQQHHQLGEYTTEIGQFEKVGIRIREITLLT